MSAADSLPDTDERPLVIETRCPECGAPTEADLWDYSGFCEYCRSLLLFGSRLEDELFAVTTAEADGDDLVEVLVAVESASFQARLEAAARDPERFSLHDIPGVIDARVAHFEQELRAALHIEHRVDFFAPYRIVEKTVIQGVLGRRRKGPKESFIQSFFTEEFERLYDRGAFHLRDRGLKIHGFRLVRLGEAHLTLAGRHFLPIVDPPPATQSDPGVYRFDRSRMRLSAETQLIAKFAGAVRERHLTTYKHLTYACVSRAGKEEHLILDRQFRTVAARLDAQEADTYLSLATQDLSRVIAKPNVRAVASECPNCGWELALEKHELISFCRTCKHAIRVTGKRLEIVRYQKGELPAAQPGESVVVYPFWSFRFRLRVGGHEYARIWDWLEAVSPQALAMRVREGDPAESRFFIPARNLRGAPLLDEAFSSLTAHVNWRQPPTVARRPAPNEPLRMLGVDVSPAEAGELAPYALLALHDNSSTRRLNARNFKALIEDAVLDLGEPALVVIPLRLRDDLWKPPGVRAVASTILEAAAPVPRIRRSFSLI